MREARSSAESTRTETAQEAPSNPVLKRAINRYVEAQRAPGTRREYAKYINEFLQALEIRALDGLTAVDPSQVVGWRNDMQARGLAPPTINGRLTAVRGLYDQLILEDRLSRNPADPKFVRRLKVSGESKTEGLSTEEVEKILRTCDGTLRGLRDRALILMLFYEGLRRSEASRLRWRDLTTKRGLLEVRNAKSSPYAKIRLRPEALRAVQDYHEVLNRELRKRETRPDDPVFTSLSRLRSYGRRLAPNSINTIVKERAKEAGIKRRISAHSWRHTCATHAFAGGAPGHEVQRHLRHADIRQTLKYDRDREIRKNPTLDVMPRLS